jgi:UDP-N-acetylglucosamine 2-epimerase
LVGTDAAKIIDRTSLLLSDAVAYASRQIDTNPYGDGHAAERIVELLLKQNWQPNTLRFSHSPALPLPAEKTPIHRAA